MGVCGEQYKKQDNLISITTSAAKTILDLADKCLCKIELNQNGIGIGFFCAIPFPDKYQRLPVMITNNHILEDINISKNKKIKFSINNEKNHFEIEIDDERKVYINKEFDITIIEIRNNDKIDCNSFLDISEDIFKDNPQKIYENKFIYLLHYPHGIKSEYSIGILKSFSKDFYTFNHSCQSNPDSSGGPLIDLIKHKVIGIQKNDYENNNFNLGMFLKIPIEDFNKKMKDKNIIKNRLPLPKRNNIDFKSTVIVNYDKEDDIVFKKYIYGNHPFYFYLEYPFIENAGNFEEIDKNEYESKIKPKFHVSGINKEIFENKSFNHGEFKKKIEENIEEIIIPKINLDNVENSFDKNVIEKFQHYRTIYEKNAKNLNKIILDLNHLSKEIYDLFIMSINLNLNINEMPGCKNYRASYLESIGFSTSYEKFYSYYRYYIYSLNINNFLCYKKIIIYIRKRIIDCFNLFKNTHNLSEEESAKKILEKFDLTSHKISRLEYLIPSNKIFCEKDCFYDFDKDLTTNFIKQINLVREQIKNYKYDRVTLEELGSIETSITAIKATNNIDLKSNITIKKINCLYNQIIEEIKKI